MPAPVENWITEKTSPAWSSLTSEQRTAWWDFAMDHPITSWNGRVEIYNGYQMFNYCNVHLAVADFNPLIHDPPTDLVSPDPLYFSYTRWTIKTQLADTSSWYWSRLIVLVDTPIPADRVIIFYQNWEKKKKPNYIPPATSNVGTRHRILLRGSALYPNESGSFDLSQVRGMPIYLDYSTGLYGNWNRSNPNVPLGKYIVVSTINGMINIQQIVI